MKLLKTLPILLVILSAHSQAKTPANYHLSDGRILVNALAYVDNNYLDPDRLNVVSLLEGALDEIQKTVPEVLAKCEGQAFCSVTVGNAVKRFASPEPKNISGLYKRLREIFLFLENNIADDTEPEKIEYAAIEGLLEKLDPHSNFLTPEIYNEFKIDTQGEFGGLGIVIGLRDNRLTVISAIDGTPAFRAGVKSKDVIAQIDKESTINLSLTEAVSKLRGPVGTKVSLKIERAGRTTPIELALTRAIIKIESVQSALLTSPAGKKIGVIKVKNFQGNTDREFKKSLQQLVAGGAGGLVLDLRNNPGGLLDQSVTLADAFLKEGTIVATVGKGRKVLDRKMAKDQKTEPDLPLIVLVNEGSASASEIVAGALKNNNRALVMGNTTFGKGSVQTVYDLPYSSALKMTIAEYLTPGNQSIQSVGIIPDIMLTPVVIDKEHFDYLPNKFASEQDLDQHLENHGIQQEKSFFELQHPAKPEEDAEEQEYSLGISAKGDTAITIALQLLENAKTADRPALLKASGPLLKTLADQEAQGIASQFQTLGLHWSQSAKTEGTPKAELTFQILKENQPVTKAVAGSKVALRVTIKNVGTGPFERLIGESDTKMPLLKNLEFPFGRIEPDKTATWEETVELPKAAPTQEATFTLKFQEAHQHIPQNVSLVLPIEALPKPKFGFQYSLDTKGAIPRGPSQTLHVRVTNEGAGPAKTVMVNLKNLAGENVFLEKGRVTLNNLLPGQTQEAQLKFHVTPAMTEGEFKAELGLSDPDLFVGVSTPIKIDLASSVIDPPAGLRYSPPDIVLNKAILTTRVNPLELTGLSRDDNQIRDIYVFVNNQKVFYLSNATKEKQMPFVLSLPLEEGSNTFLIQARDDRNLSTQAMAVIQYQHP